MKKHSRPSWPAKNMAKPPANLAKKHRRKARRMQLATPQKGLER